LEIVETLAELEARRRGRPRAYDPDTALQRARDVFWKTGYAGASLDEISIATGMNRPSLKAAFGDKRALYLRTLNAYWDAKTVGMGEALHGRPVEDALMRAYEMALATYFSGGGGARGCFVIGTAITEAIEDAEIQRIVSAGFKMLDDSFEALFRSASARGELSQDADPAALALLATATMQSMSVRARAGAPRDELWAFARKAVSVICGVR
jgi:AcrR family transcriptional regulator